MTNAFRFKDWPLRAKIVALLVAASLIPLGIATWVNIQEARERLLTNTAALLAARGDQLVGQLDTFNRGYQRAVDRVAHLPDVIAGLKAQPGHLSRFGPGVRTLLEVWPASDASIRGVAILDPSGTVRIATEDRLIGVNLSYRSFVQAALRGAAVTSDVYFADPAVGNVPTIAFVAPVWGPDRQLLGLAAFWVRAAALWEVMKASNALAGPGSFAVLFDHQGIRIAHTYSNEIVFHPGGRLAPAAIDALVAERRFGTQTRQLLEDVRAFPEQFDRSLAASPERGVFRGFAPVNRKWTYGVGRRFQTVPWTVFYMIPEQSLLGQIAQMTRQKTLFGGAIALLALLGGTLFAAVILKPIRSLSAATRAIAGGDLNARVTVDRTDELGRLGTTFNTMAGRIETQAATLAQEAAQESEARYRTLFETLIEGFCTIEMIFDASGKPVDYRFLEINPAFEKQTGLHDAQGRLMRDLAPNHEAHWFEIYGKIALTGEPLHFENEAKALGRHYDVCAYRVGGADSRKVGILFNDITERKSAERKLHAQLERVNLLQQITRAIGERQDLASIFQVLIRTLEDQLPIDFGCICLYEPTHKRLTVTRVGLRSHELAMELALTEQALIDIDENGLSRCVRGHLVYEPDIARVPFSFPQRLAKGGLGSLVAAPLLVESQVFGVLIAARRAPYSFSSGECEFLKQLSEHVALASHQAQLHGSLQIAYDELRQTQQAVMQQERLRALGQMASGIAHDINNALSPVALYTDSLLEKETALSAQGRNHLQIIQSAIHDVATTVARMREFYRKREPQLTLTPVYLNELVQQVVDLTRARWSDMPQQRGIVIELRTKFAVDPPAIMGVESEIREALTNLIFNAVDAMPEGGTLTLRTQVVGDRSEAPQVQIEVSDTGAGMDEEARRRCLEPFFTTKGERGTGLGLAMVYGVVQRHSAEIEVESAVGKGTSMRLIFAAAASSAVSIQPPTEVSVPTGLRILIVDDDPLLLKSLRDTLESDGHTITTANGGQEGIDLFSAALVDHRQIFDVLVTDLGMPYVDGRQVATSVKAASPSTPVIMLTGWGQRLVAEGDVPPHVNLVLSKPPKLRDLRGALARCCPAKSS
jgi:PAS domain S-box-containing protein